MRLLFVVAILAVVVGGVLWLLQRGRQTRVVAAPPPTPALPGGRNERCILAHGPDRGPGSLRLSPSQLVFDGDSGRVIALERLDIVGVSTSRLLPDRTIAAEVLVVTTTTDTYFWAVAHPQQWVDDLT